MTKLVDITVALCMVLYLITAVGFAWNKQWSWALVYGAYAMANIGLILAAKGL